MDGLPYVCDRDATGAAIGFGPSALEDAVSIADPATHLVVVRSGRFLGFRSDAACGGKMLQATQRAKGRLCFFNLNHGVNEQWEAADEGPPEGPADWKSRPVRLKNRRFPGCVLRVDVMRVPSEISGVAAPEIDDDLRGTHRARGPSTTKTPGSSFSADGVRRAVAFHERSIDDRRRAAERERERGPNDVSPAAWERDAPDDPGAKARELSGKARAGGDGNTHGGFASSPGENALGGGNTQTHALKSMSGVMIKEWSAFVLKEVRARKAVEAQMVALREETREWLAGFKAEVKKTKAEWVDDATYIGAAARAAREANERQRRKVASMARRTLFKRTQAAAFRRWAARARENAKRRVVVTRAVARIARFRLAAPFATWLDWTRRIKRVRAVAAKVSGLTNARAKTLAFRAWRRASLSNGGGGRRHEKLVRTLQTRAVAKMRRGALASAFGGWRAKVTELRRVRRAATMVAARWTRAAAADAFFAWFGVARGKARRKQRLSALLLQVLNRNAHARFVHWARVARRRRRERHLVRVVGERLGRGVARRAFHAWAVDAGAAANRKRRVLEFARRCVGRWATASTGRAFERWVAHVERRSEAKKRVAVVLRRRRERDLRAAYSAWATRTLCVLAARDNAVLFAVRLMRAEAHRALQRWREFVVEAGALRARVRATVVRWREARAASAFDGWRVAAAARKARRKKATAFVWRMKHASASKAFRAWAQFAQRMARLRGTVASVRADDAERSLAAAFRGWRANARDAGAKRKKAKKIVARMRFVQKSVAFERWADAAASSAEARALMRKVVRRMTRVRLASAVDAWRGFAERRRAARGNEDKARRFAARRAADRAETIWRAFLDECGRSVARRRVATRALRRMRARGMALAFETWAHAANESRRLESLRLRGAAKFARVSLSRMLRAWRQESFELARRNAVARKASRKLDALRLRRWFGEWLGRCAASLEGAALMRARRGGGRGGRSARRGRVGSGTSTASA